MAAVTKTGSSSSAGADDSPSGIRRAAAARGQPWETLCGAEAISPGAFHKVYGDSVPVNRW